jgi:hypothetical protein
MDARSNLWGTTYYGGKQSCYDGLENGSDTAFYLTATQAARAAEPQIDPSTGKRPDLGEISEA